MSFDRQKKILPEPWAGVYQDRASAIKARLDDFAAVPESEHFYELLFCILTPQSQAKNAEQVIAKLKAERFDTHPFDPTDLLRTPEHYIRFHNVKAKRLLAIRDMFGEIRELLQTHREHAPTLRAAVREKVPGFGLKESSHFLRNIGIRDLAILDRHILKHLRSLGVIPSIPTSHGDNHYFAIEQQWKRFAEDVGIPLDELDLLFWSMETGEIRK